MRLLIAAIVLVRAGVARADDFEDDDPPEPQEQEVMPPMPRSIEPPAEPSTRPWRRQASVTVAHAEVFVQVAPLGYTSSAGRSDFDAFARIGPGVFRTSARALIAAFASYEVSRLSYATFGAHALVLSRRSGWGGGLGALVDGGHAGGTVAGCWRAACLELQLRDHPDRGRTFASWLHVTVPIREVVDHRRGTE